jgi:hypothetical protein
MSGRGGLSRFAHIQDETTANAQNAGKRETANCDHMSPRMNGGAELPTRTLIAPWI